MRGLYNYIILVLAIVLANCCSDGYDPNTTFTPSSNAHYLRPSKTEFDNYLAKSFIETFEVNSIGTSWAFTAVPNWVSLNPNSGNMSAPITLSVSENLSAIEGRTGIFYLSSCESDWEYNCTMSVSQGKASPMVSLENSSLEFGGGEETQTISVISNCDWYVSNTTSWISTECNLENDILTVHVQPNPEKTYRNGYFYLCCKNRSIHVTVMQSPSTITSSEISLEYENTASSYEITINSEAEWSTTSSASWIKMTPSCGNPGKTNVKIEVSPNENVQSRSGGVTFYTGSNLRFQVKIQQKGLYIETKEIINFDASQSEYQLNINSNTDWEVISAPNWITLSAIEGKGSTSITATSTENLNSTSRTGEIILGQAGLDLRTVISVIQDGKYLSPDTSLLSFSDKVGVSSFNIISNASWSASCTASWFNTSPLNGVGNSKVNVSVTENKSSTERIGTIQYNYADNSANVNIHQQSKYLTIDDKLFDFPSIGGIHTIYICANSSWTAEIEHQVSWLKLSSVSGKNDGQLVITAENNPTINIRSTAIIIKSDYSQDIRILVSQQPRTLSLSTQKVLFFADGGYSDYLHVNTDGKYSITSDSNWFTINENNDNSFRIYATKNNTQDFRKGKITLTLTDLVNCTLSLELPVVQAGLGGSFIISGFEEDINWDSTSKGELEIKVNSYISDKNWNNNNSGTLNMTTTGYTDDLDWNKNDYSNGRGTIFGNGYGEDQVWGEKNTNTGQMNGTGYSEDINWNE